MGRWPALCSMLLLLVVIAAPGRVAVAQPVAPTTQSVAEPEDDFAPMLLVLVLLAALVVLFVVVAATVLALAVIGVTVALVLLGVVSTSVLIGVKSRRFESAARALLIQLAAIGGAVAGAVAFWTTAWLMKLPWQPTTIMVGGGLAGLVLGGLVGLALNAAWVRVRTWLISRRSGRAFEVVPPRP